MNTITAKDNPKILPQTYAVLFVAIVLIAIILFLIIKSFFFKPTHISAGIVVIKTNKLQEYTNIVVPSSCRNGKLVTTSKTDIALYANNLNVLHIFNKDTTWQDVLIKLNIRDLSKDITPYLSYDSEKDGRKSKRYNKAEEFLQEKVYNLDSAVIFLGDNKDIAEKLKSEVRVSEITSSSICK
jgi:hypothetical protein